MACVVHCQFSVEVECGDLTGVLVVRELQISPVPGDVERNCKKGVGSEVGRESWWGWVVHGWLRCPRERLFKLLPPAKAMPIVHEVELLVAAQWCPSNLCACNKRCPHHGHK